MDYRTPQFYRVMQYAANVDRDVIDMVSGTPDWGPPAALREGLHEYADADDASFRYPPSEGLADLRAEIADRRGVPAERVVVTNGAGEANYLGMAAALDRHDEPDGSGSDSGGSEALLTDPVYSYYPGKVSLLGGDARYVRTDPDGALDPEAVREAASDETALIVVNTPNNPTGAVYPADVMAELVAVAEEHDAYLLSDEVYDHFDQSGRFASALGVDSAHRIVTNSFSKSMAVTGLRVGYGVFPESVVDAARTRHMLVNVTGSRPAQYAVLHALRSTGPEYYARARERLTERIETFTDALDTAGAAYTRPEGGFYVLARFEGFQGSFENVERLIDEAGVAGMPGEAFGESRAEWLRFALLTPEVETAARRLVEFFE